MYKKALLALLSIFFLFSITFAQVEIEHVSQATVKGNEILTIKLDITMTEAQSAVDIAELLPAGWEVISWDISGYDKSQVTYEWFGPYVFNGKERNVAHWNLKDVQNDFTITYKTKAVTENIQTEFVTILVYPEGFSSKMSIISVIPSGGLIKCGNEICDIGENIFNCPKDCKLQLQFPSTDIMITIASVIISVIIIIIVYKLKTRIEGIAKVALQKQEKPLIKEYVEKEERIKLPPVTKYSEAEAMRRLMLIARKKKFKKYKKKR